MFSTALGRHGPFYRPEWMKSLYSPAGPRRCGVPSAGRGWWFSATPASPSLAPRRALDRGRRRQPRAGRRELALVLRRRADALRPPGQRAGLPQVRSHDHPRSGLGVPVLAHELAPSSTTCSRPSPATTSRSCTGRWPHDMPKPRTLAGAWARDPRGLAAAGRRPRLPVRHSPALSFRSGAPAAEPGGGADRRHRAEGAPRRGLSGGAAGATGRPARQSHRISSRAGQPPGGLTPIS